LILQVCNIESEKQICPEDFLKEIVDTLRMSGLKIHIHISEEV